MTPATWLIVRASRSVIGGLAVVAYGLTEDQARKQAATYKRPHRAMPERELLAIRTAALDRERGAPLSPPRG